MEKLRLEEDIETQMSERFVTGVFIDNELSGICAFVNLGNNTGNILQMYVRKGFLKIQFTIISVQVQGHWRWWSSCQRDFSYCASNPDFGRPL